MTGEGRRDMMTRKREGTQNLWRGIYHQTERQETRINTQEAQEKVIDLAAKAHIETEAHRATDQAQDQGHQVTEVTTHRETQATTDHQTEDLEAEITNQKTTKDLEVMMTNMRIRKEILTKVIQKKTLKNMMTRK